MRQMSCDKIRMGKLLASLRKLQFISSAYSTCTLVNKPLFCLQFCLFTVGFLCAIVGRFYFWERYHLYGCRKNYWEGFPSMCPSDRRPSLLDMYTATCYCVTFTCLVVMTLLPMVWSNFHWKCALGNEIVHHSNKVFKKYEIKQDSIDRVQTVLLSLEHASNFCLRRKCKSLKHRQAESHRLLVHLGSCIWSELFFHYHHKRRVSLAVLVIGIMLSVVIPCIEPIKIHGWPGFLSTFAMLIFYISPMFCGILLVIFALCMASSSPHVGTILLLSGWTFVTAIFTTLAFTREKCDEQDLMRESYTDDLPLFVSDVKTADVDVMLHLRGYGRHNPLQSCQKVKSFPFH